MYFDEGQEQLFCFQSSESNYSRADFNKDLWHLYVDGAARQNPGPAGAGIFITKNDIPVLKKGFFLGCKTNNQAEYIAFLLGLYHLKSMVIDMHNVDVTCYSDSLLMVKQLNGQYKVLDQKLKKLFDIAKLYNNFVNMRIKHVPREKNVEADEAANWGIDQKVPLPKDFLSINAFE